MNTVTVNVCSNCDANAPNRYCDNCSQYQAIKQLTRPGKVAHEYIEGKIKRILNPVTYFLLAPVFFKFGFDAYTTMVLSVFTIIMTVCGYQFYQIKRAILFVPVAFLLPTPLTRLPSP